MRMSRFLLILFLVLTIVFNSRPVFSQQKTVVKGSVFNAETNEPVINATIVVSGTKKGTREPLHSRMH